MTREKVPYGLSRQTFLDFFFFIYLFIYFFLKKSVSYQKKDGRVMGMTPTQDIRDLFA